MAWVMRLPAGRSSPFSAPVADWMSDSCSPRRAWFGSLVGFLAGRRAHSRIRQLLITRVVRVGFAANNRLDYDSMCVFFHPAVEIRLLGGGAAGIDLDPVYRGHEGLRKVLDDWRAGFEQFRFEPREAIDPGGDRFGVLVEFHGRTSGVVTRQLSGFIFTLGGGLAVRQDIHWDSAAAVEALLARANQASSLNPRVRGK